MNKNKGFTLIELLVVIAIIGILSSVVLASLSNAREKGRDAAVKSQLASMKAQSELYYSKNETYYNSATDNLCVAEQDDGGLKGLIDSTIPTAGSASAVAVDTAGTGFTSADDTVVRCRVSTSPTDKWVVIAPLSTAGEYYCVDNTGLSKQTATNAIVDGTYSCPE
jgi:prepilin-type N-terminal cleavage/methylation domain-containing protein